MSVIVAVRKGPDIVLAADTQSNWGSHTVGPDNHRASKIRKIGSSYVGSTGWAVYDNILEDYLAGKKAPSLLKPAAIFSFFMKLWKELHKSYPFVNDQADKDHESPFGDLGASFLIVNKNGIFLVDGDTSVSHFEKYYAVGAGEDFSLGALYTLYTTQQNAETLARKAVEAAITFSTKCGGPIELVQVRATR